MVNFTNKARVGDPVSLAPSIEMCNVVVGKCIQMFQEDDKYTVFTLNSLHHSEADQN